MNSRKRGLILSSLIVRPTRYAHCGKSPQGAAMMRNLRPEEQLRGGNEPRERKVEGKARRNEQKLNVAGWTDEVTMNPQSNTSPRVHRGRCRRREGVVRVYLARRDERVAAGILVPGPITRHEIVACHTWHVRWRVCGGGLIGVRHSHG